MGRGACPIGAGTARMRYAKLAERSVPAGGAELLKDRHRAINSHPRLVLRNHRWRRTKWQVAPPLQSTIDCQ